MKEGGKRLRGICKSDNHAFPLISIITIVYNGQDSIEKTIESVINQTYTNIEYIVIDGHSTDNTLSIIRKYDEYIDYWRSEPDKGISDAFNKGYKHSTGSYIAFLNSGDWYEQNGIKMLTEQIDEDYSIYCGHVNLYSLDGEKFLETFRSRPWRLLQTMRIAHPATLTSRKVFEKIGLFSEDFKYAMDYDFILRAFLNDFKIKVVDNIITNMTIGGNSSNTRCVFKEELVIKNKNIGRKKRHFIWYLLNLLFHRQYVYAKKIVTLFAKKYL